MRRSIQTLLVVSLSVGLMAFFLGSADLGGVWLGLRTARWELVLVAALLSTLTYLIRVVRWQQMLGPIGRTRFSVAFRATVIGFAVTSVLPGRVGEVLRPYLLARREGMSATAVFATIVFERLLDMMTVLLLFGLFLVVFDPGIDAGDGQLLQALKIAGAMGALVAAMGFVVMVAVAGHPERIGRTVLKADRVLPRWIARGLAILSRRFTEGLAVARHPRALMASMALSLTLWLMIASGIWCVSEAFELGVPFTGSFPLMMLLVLGVAVPTPAGIGSFHAAFQIGATTFFGAPNESAVGAALVLHAVSFLPVTLVGILLMAHEGVQLHQIRELVSSVESDSQSAPPRQRLGSEGPDVTLVASETHDEGSTA